MEISKISGLLVMPNEQELAWRKKHNIRNPYRSPIAVRNRNVSRGQLTAFENEGVIEQVGFQTIAKEYPAHKFLYHVMVAKGVPFNKKHLATIDQAQDIPESPYFVIYQTDMNNSLKEFEDRLDEADKNFSDKIKFPVVDPATSDMNDLIKKCKLIVKRGYGAVVVLSRSPKTHKDGWQTLQAELTPHVEMLALGVYRRWHNLARGMALKKVSTLCGPAVFGCKGMSHYRPFRGGKSDLVCMTSQMCYEPMGNVSSNVSYNGLTKNAKIQSLKKSYHYEFTRIDAVLEAQELFEARSPLKTRAELQSAILAVDGISEIAQELGL